MPYSASNEPANVKKLSPHKRRVWRAAFNAAYTEYHGDESKAFATAWAAANGKAETTDGRPFDNVTQFIRDVNAPPTRGGITARASAWESFREFIDAFNENQPRDDRGKWSSGGSGTGDPQKSPHEVSRNQVLWSRQYAQKQVADERQKRYDAYYNAHTAWERGGRQGPPPDHKRYGLTAMGASAATIGRSAVTPTSPAEKSEPPISPAEHADVIGMKPGAKANLSLAWVPPQKSK